MKLKFLYIVETFQYTITKLEKALLTFFFNLEAKAVVDVFDAILF